MHSCCKAEENKIFVHNTQQDTSQRGEPESRPTWSRSTRGITSSLVHLKPVERLLGGFRHMNDLTK